MILRRLGLALLVAAFLLPSTAALAGPALVFEPQSGTVFYSEDPDVAWFPASLTKLMVAYIAFEDLKAGRIKPDTEITCDALCHAQAPSHLGLPVGGQLPFGLALKVMIVKSANDVAVMVAEALGGGTVQGFLTRMNATAKRLGMTRTHYVNVNGLPEDGQVTTARDLAKLARAIILQFPKQNYIFSIQQIAVDGKVVHTPNHFLADYKGADGMKTGFICNSGFNIVASATRNGRRLVAVVLGEVSAAARRRRTEELLNNAFKRYFWKSVFGTTIDALPRQTGLSDTPPHLRAQICGGRGFPRHVASRKRKAHASHTTTKQTHKLNLNSNVAAEGTGQ